jgi:demethoxyubiquinone hydroxylase (CLK1/Coq7/Cat5 family)
VKSSRKRRFDKMEEDKNKDEIKDLKELSDKKEEEIVKLEREIQAFRDQELDHQDNAEKLHRLYQLGIIDKDGEPVDQNE